MILGKMVINTKVTKIGIKNGNTPFVTVDTDMLPTRATTNNAIPIGGVKMPIIMFKVVITPKNTRSIPNCIAIGMSIGKTRNCNAKASMNIPRNNIKAREAGKPENLVDHIAQGALKKYYKENTLLDQLFVKDNKLTIAQYLQAQSKSLTVTAFKRVTLKAE